MVNLKAAKQFAIYQLNFDAAFKSPTLCLVCGLNNFCTVEEMKSQLTCSKQIHFLLIRMHTAAVSKQTRAIAYISLHFELIFAPSQSTDESSNRKKNSSEISFYKDRSVK